MFTGPRDAAVNNTAERTWGPISPVNASENRGGYALHNFRLPIENLPNAVLIAGGTGNVLAANSAAERIFGYGPGQLVGQQFEDWCPVGRLVSLLNHGGPSLSPGYTATDRSCRSMSISRPSSTGPSAMSSPTSVRQAMASDPLRARRSSR